MSASLLRHPSAFIPLSMSFIALAMVIGDALIYGIVYEADEGTAAHIFQLLMMLQVPVILFFAVKWMPRAPLQALTILILQAVAAFLAILAVIFLT